MSDDIPIQWTETTLGNMIGTMEGGVSVNSEDRKKYANEFGILKTSAVSSGQFFPSQHKTILPDEVKRARVHPIADHILFSRMNTPSLVGESCYVADNHNDLFLPDRLWQISVKDPRDTDTKWLSYILSFDKTKKLISDVATGTSGSMKNISKPNLLSITVPYPPKPEQEEIASILTSVDEVIAKTEAQINKLQDLKKGMMQELLTKGIGHNEFKDSPVGRIPKGWDVVELSTIAAKKYGIVDGPFGSNLKTEHYRESGIPVIQSGFVTSGTFKATQYVYVDRDKYQEQIRSSTSGGDIVMAKIGAKSGACALLPMEHPTGVLAGNSLKITVDETKAVKEFILHILHFYRNRGILDNIRTETAQPALSIFSLKRLKIPCPPKEEQRKIAGAVDSIDALLGMQTAKLNRHRNLKRSLMQDLLTGKVRVKVN